MENGRKIKPIERRNEGEILEAMECLVREITSKEPDLITMYYPTLIDVCREVFYWREENRRGDADS